MAHLTVSDLLGAPEVLSHVNFAVTKAGSEPIAPAPLSDGARQHLNGCAVCRKGLVDLRALAHITEGLARRIPPSRFRARSSFTAARGRMLAAAFGGAA